MWRLVIFDFDGTIADSGRAIAQTAQLALAEIGEAPVAESAFVARIGLPLAQIFAEIVPSLDARRLAAVVAAYRELYPEISRRHTRVFDGMRELLARLRARGLHLAVATGKSTAGAHRAIADLDLGGPLFDCVVGTDGVARPKPHADMVNHIRGELGVAAADACVVGDTSFDMQMSVSAGVACCGVTWGSHSRGALMDAGASWVVDTRAELADVLEATRGRG